MNQLSVERRAQIVRCLVEGNSVRATSRLTKAAINTVIKLSVDLGEMCALYPHHKLLKGRCSYTSCMASTDRQPVPNSPPSPGAVLRLIDGTVCTMVKPGRQAPPLTVIVRQRAEPEREIPLADVGEVMWSP